MIQIATKVVSFQFHVPFTISRGVMTEEHCVQLTLTDAQGHIGHAEAIGLDYEGETPESIIAQISQVAGAVQEGLSRDELQRLLPACGARNAIDCALWDLEAKRSGVPAWQAAGLKRLKPVETAYTFGIMDDADLRRMASQRADLTLVKVKTNLDRALEPVRIVHAAIPNARIIVDPNQAWTAELLRTQSDQLAALNVVLLEQPLAVGADDALRELRLPIPVAADESFTDTSSIPALRAKYQVLNIKLDKTGGLTEALRASQAGLDAGMRLMVGCMGGSSLGMAPGVLVAQHCDFVDLDGPLLISTDVKHPLEYRASFLSPPNAALWG